MKTKTKFGLVFYSGLIFVGLLGLFGAINLDRIDDWAAERLGRRIFTVGEGFVPEAQENYAATGAFWRVEFTTPGSADNHIERSLIQLIAAADESIHIASFEFDLEDVAEALIQAEGRGVEVQWVTDDEHGIFEDVEEGEGLFERMAEGGVEVKDDRRGALMHNKFWVFDGEIVWTGSTNITKNGTLLHNNNVIVVDSRDLAGVYEREFQEMWTAGEFGPESTSTLGEQLVNIEGTEVVALFGPEDGVSLFLQELLLEAEERIVFLAFSFTDDEVGALMADKVLDGVDVRGVFETRGSTSEYSQMGTLYCAGASVRKDGNLDLLHHKVIVIDERIVVTGSYNFSRNADQSNDENILVIDNAEIAKAYLDEFARRWGEAGNPVVGEDVVCE